MGDFLIRFALGVFVFELSGFKYGLSLRLRPLPLRKSQPLADIIPAILPRIARETVNDESLRIF